MELRAQRSDLVRELGLAQGIVERKNTIPILSNIELTAKKGRLELASTDLEIGLSHGLTAKVKKQGRFTVSAKKLFDIVRALPGDEVSLSLEENNRLHLKCGPSDFRIVGLDPADFPVLPACDFEHSFQIKRSVLATAVAKVQFAVTLDESRFPLGGALFVARADGLLVVATDGHRLAMAESDIALKGLDQESRFIVPRKALLELRKIMDLGGEAVSIESKENHLFMRLDDRTLIARAMEDEFPSYDKVVPTGNDKKVDFDRSELEGAVKRVALLAPEKAGAVKLSFADDLLVVSSSNPEFGDAHEELKCSFSDERLEIGFNAQYLSDFLNVVETERLTIELKDGVTQGLLKPFGTTEEVRHQYVIMPMRI